MTSSRRVTSREVAEAAGVSRATVSYVLNGVTDQRIPQATRDHVREVANRLGYAPNAAARALRHGKTDIVLLANPPWALGPAVAAGLAAAVERLERRGFTPLVALGQAATRERLVRECQRAQPVGVIGPGDAMTHSAVRLMRASGTQAILAIDSKPLADVPALLFDQAELGRLAIGYLAERGHRRVLAVMPAAPDAERDLATVRLDGARVAAAACGMRLDQVEVGLEREAVQAATRSARAQPEPATAVYAYNDEYAMTVVNVLIRDGVAVPEDVAVIGCDDIPAAGRFRPALTTIWLPTVELYGAAADVLLMLMDGEEVAGPFDYEPPRVVRRDSA